MGGELHPSFLRLSIIPTGFQAVNQLTALAALSVCGFASSTVGDKTTQRVSSMSLSYSSLMNRVPLPHKTAS